MSTVDNSIGLPYFDRAMMSDLEACAPRRLVGVRLTGGDPAHLAPIRCCIENLASNAVADAARCVDGFGGRNESVLAAAKRSIVCAAVNYPAGRSEVA